MKHVKRNELLEDDIDMDVTIYGGLDFDNLKSWSQVVMWSAINGVKINYEVFKFFISGICDSRISDMLSHTLKTTAFLDEFANTIETMQLIYKFTSVEYIIHSKLVAKWQKLKKKIDNDVISYPIIDSPDFMLKAIRFKLFSEIDTKFPLLQLKFYNTYKKSLLIYDRELVKWILNRTKVKAKYNLEFLKFVEQIQKDLSDYNTISAFLN